jgi:hypothetical protein
MVLAVGATEYYYFVLEGYTGMACALCGTLGVRYRLKQLPSRLRSQRVQIKSPQIV